ncbi:MAG: HNH endonuclease, partial [Phycisphaerae bacterium]|nr:HNH endonuclease [Phycisphaerae bacterium]
RMLSWKPMTPRPKGCTRPKRRAVSRSDFERDPDVVAWILMKANGVCEDCRSKAPFETPRGIPYLEVHHVHRLADGGPDTTANAVALCPNCHRRAHHGTDPKGSEASLRKQLERRGY